MVSLSSTSIQYDIMRKTFQTVNDISMEKAIMKVNGGTGPSLDIKHCVIKNDLF